VAERLFELFASVDGDPQTLNSLLLANDLRQFLGPQRIVALAIIRAEVACPGKNGFSCHAHRSFKMNIGSLEIGLAEQQAC
jgi:hypothetical protein